MDRSHFLEIPISSSLGLWLSALLSLSLRVFGCLSVWRFGCVLLALSGPGCVALVVRVVRSFGLGLLGLLVSVSSVSWSQALGLRLSVSGSWSLTLSL
jgi:hypothetical protein